MPRNPMKDLEKFFHIKHLQIKKKKKREEKKQQFKKTQKRYKYKRQNGSNPTGKTLLEAENITQLSHDALPLEIFGF